jgi:hypothetical protein
VTLRTAISASDPKKIGITLSTKRMHVLKVKNGAQTRNGAKT